jgi:hypothetical protein
MNQVTDDGRRQGVRWVQEATGEYLIGALGRSRPLYISASNTSN